MTALAFAAPQLPQGTITGQLLTGDGNGQLTLGAPCSVVIKGSVVESTSLTSGTLNVRLESLPAHPSTFLGVTGAMAIDVELDQNGLVFQFAKMPLIGGQPTPTGDARTAICQVGPLR